MHAIQKVTHFIGVGPSFSKWRRLKKLPTHFLYLLKPLVFPTEEYQGYMVNVYVVSETQSILA